MDFVKQQPSWAAFLKFYSEQNKGRATRLGVFEREGDVMNDYWIEDGLPLVGVDLDTSQDLPTIEIQLDGYSHSIREVRSFAVHYSQAAEEEGLDISDAGGKTTIFRYE